MAAGADEASENAEGKTTAQPSPLAEAREHIFATHLVCASRQIG